MYLLSSVALDRPRHLCSRKCARSIDDEVVDHVVASKDLNVLSFWPLKVRDRINFGATDERGDIL